MSRSKTVIGACLVTVLVVAILVAGLAVMQVRRVTAPRRAAATPFDFAATGIAVETLTLRSVDGLDLAGWQIPGASAYPPIILAHDLGSDKASLAHLALMLNERGFPVLLFDFRGHGGSAWGRASLGLREKRDVLGAVDYLAATRGGAPRVGVYGVGMGAFAAVLAAADRRSIQALVLDGLYPNAGYPLRHGVFGRWDAGAKYLGFLPEAIFGLINDRSIYSEQAPSVLRGLSGKDVLLLAPAGEAQLAVEMQLMYEAIPEQRETDGNFALLPATQSHGVYGRDLELHHRYVVDFFASRLEPAASRRAARP